MNLNEKQKEAIINIYGPILIIAGPGSGKTKTLVERVLCILNKENVKPKNILLATFTDKSAKELISRVSEKIEKNINLSEMYIGTIHSICLRIIDENIEKSILKRNYKVLDDLEQKFFIYANMKNFEKVDGYNDFFQEMEIRGNWRKASLLRNWIDKINEIQINKKQLDKSNLKHIKFLKEVHKKYKEFLFLENSIDFSNIQLECLRILKDNNEILKKIQNEIEYIMIDEYQDTNKIQEELFLLIAGKKKNICVVGDDDQAIYRFRGATTENILKFQNNFPEGECKKIELEINYRSNKDIVDFCNLWNKCLNWDNYRHDKKIISGKERKNQTLGVIKIAEKSEYKWQEKLARFVYFLKKIGKIEDYNEIAFLFRSVRNKKVLSLIEAIEKRGIPVYSPRSNRFFLREEIEFIIGLFLMIFPQSKEIVFSNKYSKKEYYRECYNFAKNIIKKDNTLIEEMKKIRMSFEFNNEKNHSNFLSVFYSLIETGADSLKKFFNLEENNILLNRSTYNLAIFSKILNTFDELCKIEKINESNVVKLLNYFFNQHLKYLIESGIAEYEDIKEYAPKGAVSFLTIHQGKGLEFPCVIVGSLEERPTIPKNSMQISLENIFGSNSEPEYRKNEFDFWRMYYTAFSRAQNLLALTCIENSYKPTPSIPFKRVYEDLRDVSDNNFNFSKLKFESIKKINIKEILAFTTHISLYNKCPLLYKFQKKYKFVPLKNKGMIFGVLVHETLEDINSLIFNRKNITTEDIKNIFITNYKYLNKKYKLNIEKDVLEIGEKSILEYYKNYPKLFDSIKNIEIKISLTEKDYILEGIADLVVENKGNLELIDFKTGKKGNLEEEYINQLEIYAYLLNKKYNQKIIKGKLYYLGETSSNKITEIIFTEEKLLKAFYKFDEISKKILSDEYQTSFDKHSIKCQNCILRKYCESK